MKDGYNADALHGDLSQAQRDTVMQKFRIRNIQLLVATDVAARGLDVSDLTHVINYNLPDDVEIYTHRSGRTGRANKKGVSVSIIHSKEKFKIKDIERMLNKKFEQQQIPNGLEVCKKQLFHMIDKMQQVEVNDEQIEPYMEQIMKQLEYLDKTELLKRFVSLEFNRFLNYYKDAEDLNYHERDRGMGRDDRGGDRGARGDRGSKRGDKIRFKMNVGNKDGINPSRLLGIINEIVGDKTISVGDIEVTNKYTFFDIFADQSDKIVNAFAEQKDIELGVARESKGFSEASGSRRPDSGKRRTDRPNSSDGGYRRKSSGDDRKSSGGSWKPEGNNDRRSESRRKTSNSSDKPWRNRR
jgi:ATP-dependent RNA helicase DeaD